MADFKRIVIFGANGMLGEYVARHFAEHNVVKLTRADFDFNVDATAVLEYLRTVILPGDLVVNCVGLTNKRQFSDEAFYRVNSVLPRLMATVCEEKEEARMAHITTDCVFSGSIPPGRANSIRDRYDVSDIYGLSKSLGDTSVPKDKYPHCAVFRTSIIGEENFNRSLVEWVLSQPRGSTVSGYTNHFWNGVTCLKLAQIIEMYASLPIWDWSGEHIIATSQPVSKYTLVSIINDVYDCGLTVNKTEPPKAINRMLDADTNRNWVEESLTQQIQEMKAFDVLFRRT